MAVVAIIALLSGRRAANASAISEREFGCCAGVDDFIYVSGHSGVGGAIFAGGTLYRGAEGLAGGVDQAFRGRVTAVGELVTVDEPALV